MTFSAVVSLDRAAAMIFDTDGVITDTARIHAAAWKRVFDAGEDYLRHVDGKPRTDGVRHFLLSRGITEAQERHRGRSHRRAAGEDAGEPSEARS